MITIKTNRTTVLILLGSLAPGRLFCTPYFDELFVLAYHNGDKVVAVSLATGEVRIFFEETLIEEQGRFAGCDEVRRHD